MFAKKLLILCVLFFSAKSLGAMKKQGLEGFVINKNIADEFDLILRQETPRRKVFFDDRLFVECGNGNLKNVKNLLKSNIDVNQNIALLGGTALIRSVYHNYYDIAQLLLDNKADPNVVEASYPYNKTAVDYAWELERDDLFVLLLMHGGIPKKYAKVFNMFDFVFEALAALIYKYCNHFALCSKKEIALLQTILQGIEDNFITWEIFYTKNINEKKYVSLFSKFSHFTLIFSKLIFKLLSLAQVSQKRLLSNALTQFLSTSKKLQKKFENKKIQNERFIYYLKRLNKSFVFDVQMVQNLKNQSESFLFKMTN